MRYILYGAGAVGGVIGGRLAMAGCDVLLICRGEHLAAINRDGLLLRDAQGEHRVGIPAVSHPREIDFRDGDVVILTMKSQDTDAALSDLELAAGTDVPVVCCQNGVANERMAARRFDNVYGMQITLPSSFLEAGAVNAWGSPYAGVLDAGCFPTGVDEVITQTTADLTRAGFISRPDAAIMRMKYAKLARNLGNAMEALCGVDMDDASMKPMIAKLQEEAYACFAAAGIDVASNDEYRRQIGNWSTQRIQIPGVERGHRSTWQSLVKGRTRLETDYLNGEIVLLGKLHGVPTPRNSLLRRLSAQAAAGGGAETYTLAQLEAMAEQAAAGVH